MKSDVKGIKATALFEKAHSNLLFEKKKTNSEKKKNVSIR